MGYLSKVPGITSITKVNQPRWTSVVRKIHQWIYSWMKPGYVEDEEEYIISKCLLLQFVCSARVLTAAEGNLFMITKILRFLRGYVFVYEDLYLYYLRKKHRTMWTAHSSAHEVSYFFLIDYCSIQSKNTENDVVIFIQGTNLGLKNHAAAVKPTMNLDTAANAIGVQQDLKVKDIEEKITADFQKTHKIWSSLPHSSKTTTFGEGLLKNVHDRHIFYEAKCVGLQKFQCLYVGDELNEIKDTDTNEFSNVPIPLFSRVREVSVAQDGTMSCNCYTFESVGHYCAHQVCIAKLVHEANDVEFHGFTHHETQHH